MKEIVFPKSLVAPLAQASKGERAALCTLFVLKSINQSGIHTAELSQKRGHAPVRKLNRQEIELVSNIQNQSCKQTENHIKTLVSLGFLAFSNNSNEIYVSSFETICKHYGVYAGKSRKRIKPNQRKIADIILKLAHQQVCEEQRNAFHTRLKCSENLRSEFKSIVGANELRSEEILNRQLDALRKGTANNENAWLLMAFRADFNVNYRTLTEIWGKRGKGSAAYIKRKLQRLGLAYFQHREEVINGSEYTTNLQRQKGVAARFGRVWHKDGQKRGEISLFLPDSATFFNHNEPLTEKQIQLLKTAYGK